MKPDVYVRYPPSAKDTREGYDGYLAPAQYTGRVSGNQMMVTFWVEYQGRYLTWKQWVHMDDVLSPEEVEAIK